MPRSTTFSLTLITFTLLSQLPLHAARVDRCHGDQNIVFQQFPQANCSKPSRLVSVQRLHGNPYHSLHDSIWAVAHYLSRCLRYPMHTHIYINSTVNMQLSLCSREPAVFNRSIQPIWGACMLRYTAIKAGLPASQFYVSAEKPAICLTAETTFRPTFREFNYRVRPAGEKEPSKPRQRMPPRLCERAMRYLAAAATQALPSSKPFSPRDSRVRVLLYDRKDVRRRQWRNAGALARAFANDTHVSLRHVSAMPHAVLNQAALFAWADVLVTPHGAGMANSIFLAAGAEVVEVWKCCRDDVRVDPELPRRWTGWHAALMRLRLHYLQCHRPGKPMSSWELAKPLHSEPTERWCSLHEFDVDVDEAVALLGEAVARQRGRITRIRLQTWWYWLPNVLSGLSVALIVGRLVLWQVERPAKKLAPTRIPQTS